MANEAGMRMENVVSKIRNIKTFLFQQRTRVRIIPQDQVNCHPPSSSNINDTDAEGACSPANCSSYNMGFPLRTCVRVCSIIGMLSSLLYIIAGTSLITHISQTETVGFSTFTAPKLDTATTRHIYYKRNVGFFIGIAVILVILNVIQLLSDLFLFISTFRPKKYTALWVNMVLHITLWIMTLICFITIFSGGGLFLLLVFLLGTAIRAYITFILHEYMIDEEFKVEDEGELNLGKHKQASDLEKCTPSPKDRHLHHLQPSPIPEEITTVEPYSEIENNEEDQNVDVTQNRNKKGCEILQGIKPDKEGGCNQNRENEDETKDHVLQSGRKENVTEQDYSYPDKADVEIASRNKKFTKADGGGNANSLENCKGGGESCYSAHATTTNAPQSLVRVDETRY